MNVKRVFGKKRLLVLAVVLVLASVSLSVLIAEADEPYFLFKPTTKTPKVDKEAATNIAKQVFQKMRPGAVVEEIELTQKGSLVAPIWVARSGKKDYDKDEVEIDGATGKLIGLLSGTAMDNALASLQAKHPLLPEEEVLKRATARGKSFGIAVPDSKPTEATSYRQIDSEEEGTVQWMFKWARESRGYKYYNDWFLIIADGYKGEIIGSNKRYESVEPSTFAINVSKERALQLASTISAKNGFDVRPENAVLMIVNPNYRWTAENFVLDTVEARLAWVIDFKKTEEGHGSIWIDAATGEKLGGDETR
ncbi:MAG: hypothetical protein KGZ93_00885 [Actinobacteria bacterium]|nr:hypothetical protein [Actinomycetota bacterium]